MPTICCAMNCTSRDNKKTGMKMYRFPTDPSGKDAWVRAIRRESWRPSDHSRVCKLHFISGKPIRIMFLQSSVLLWVLQVSREIRSVDTLVAKDRNDSVSRTCFTKCNGYSTCITCQPQDISKLSTECKKIQARIRTLALDVCPDVCPRRLAYQLPSWGPM